MKKRGDRAEGREERKRRIREAYSRQSPVVVIPATKAVGGEGRMLRVAAYCRVSTDSEMQASSFELQRQEYEEKIKKEDKWQFAGIYADEGLSGTSVEKRKQFQQMIQDCREGRIDLILVKNVSRFMRNQVVCLQYIRELENLSPPVGVVFETENIDTRKPGYELILGFYSAFAQADSENKSQSIKWANERRWRKGIFHCNTDQFFGYTKNDIGKMVIIPEEARLIRQIYRRYNAGYNVCQIANWLTKARIPTFFGNEVWPETSVRNILKNEAYCGDLVRQKTFRKNFLNRKVIRNTGQLERYFLYDNHPPIIGREQWDSVQEQLKFRRAGRAKPRKPLRIRRMGDTLAAFCLLDPRWDGYDLARAKNMLFTHEERNITEWKKLI